MEVDYDFCVQHELSRGAHLQKKCPRSQAKRFMQCVLQNEQNVRLVGKDKMNRWQEQYEERREQQVVECAAVASTETQGVAKYSFSSTSTEADGPKNPEAFPFTILAPFQRDDGKLSTWCDTGRAQHLQPCCFNSMAIVPQQKAKGVLEDDDVHRFVQPTPFHPAVGRPISVFSPIFLEPPPRKQERGATDPAVVLSSSLPITLTRPGEMAYSLLNQASLEHSSVGVRRTMEAERTITISHPITPPATGRLRQEAILPSMVMPLRVRTLESYPSEFPFSLAPRQRWQQLPQMEETQIVGAHRKQSPAEQVQILCSSSSRTFFGQEGKPTYFSVHLNEPYEGSNHRPERAEGENRRASHQDTATIVSTEEKTSCHLRRPWLSDNIVAEKASDSQRDHLSPPRKKPPVDSTMRSIQHQGRTKKLPPMSTRLAKTMKKNAGFNKSGKEGDVSPPVRLLNSRNFFYIEMRTWLLGLDDTRLQEVLYGHQPSTVNPASAALPSTVDHWTASRICTAFVAENGGLSQEERMGRLLSLRQSKCRTPRKHRRVHGKLSFNQMNALIHMGWKALSERDKEFYRDVSKADSERWQVESAEYEQG